MSASQAQDFARRFPTVVTQFNDTATSFSATVFADIEGNLTLAIRGTLELSGAPSDLVPTDLHVYAHGAGYDQIVAIHNWWLRAGTPANEPVRQFAVRESLTSPPPGAVELYGVGPFGTGYLMQVGDGVGTGELVAPLAGDAGRKIDVTGHSLGGHLAMAFGALFGAVTGQVTAFNAPGFKATAPNEAFFAALNNGTIPAGANTRNVIADEARVGSVDWSAIAGYHSRPGVAIDVPIENQWLSDEPQPATGAWNHSQGILTDSLAVYALLAELDPALDTGSYKSMLGGVAQGTASGLERLVDTARGLLGFEAAPLPTGNAAASRDAMYRAIGALRGDERFAGLAGKLRLVPTAAAGPALNADTAKSDFGTFLALKTTSPFALVPNSAIPGAVGALHDLWQSAHAQDYAAWQADLLLSDAQRDAGQANFSDQWYADRAELLRWTLVRNERDAAGVLTPASTGQPIAEAVHLTDAGQGTSILVGAVDNDAQRRQIHFGSPDQPNTIQGFGKDDRIYGGARADALEGRGGNDHLEGGAGIDDLQGGEGNDTLAGGADSDALRGGAGDDLLIGGAGSDAYYIDSGEGVDTIIDADGLGRIVWDGETLGGGLKLDDGVWLSADERFRYALARDERGTALIISRTDTSARLVVSNFDATIPGHLGITLLEAGFGRPLPVTDGPPLPDFFNPQSYPPSTIFDTPANDLVVTSEYPDHVDARAGGDDLIRTGALDWLSLSADTSDVVNAGPGSDYVDSDAGPDAIGGGLGSDWILSGPGGDVVYPAADLPTDPWGTIASTGLIWYWASGLAPFPFEGPFPGDAIFLSGYGADAEKGSHSAGYWIRGLYFEISIATNYGPTDFVRQQFPLDWRQPLPPGDYSINFHSEPAVFDYVDAGSGQDLVAGGDGNDIFFGRAGIDWMEGGGGDDYIDGGPDGDVLQGDGPIPDVWFRLRYLTGPEGHDILFGRGGRDLLDGGGGNDYLDGGDDGDIIDGGAGDDVIVGGPGADQLRGGAGNDTYLYDAGDGGDGIADFAGRNQLVFGAGILPGEVAVALAGDGQLQVSFSPAATVSFRMSAAGSEESSSLADGYPRALAVRTEEAGSPAGADAITVAARSGEEPFAQLSGGLTFAFATGERFAVSELLAAQAAAPSTIEGGAGGDVLLDLAGDDAIVGGDGADTIHGLAGRNRIDAGAGDDRVFGLFGTYVIDGGDGADLLVGGETADEILGGSGDDSLYGSDGADELSGGAGDDLLDGQDGDDTYLFSRGGGADRIVESGSGHDRIVFGPDVAATEVIAASPGQSLELAIAGTGDRLTVSWQAGAGCPVEEIAFADGTLWRVLPSGEVSMALSEAPAVQVPIDGVAALEDAAFSFAIPPATFANAEGATLTATGVGGQALPPWLSFEAASATLHGTPGNDDVGEAGVTVTASSAAGAASEEFVVSVINVNDAPVVALPLADRAVEERQAASWVIPAGHFVDVDAADTLYYSASGEAGGPLPAWLDFDPATRTFSGTPGEDDVATTTIRVAAADAAGAEASDDFLLAVQPMPGITLSGTTAADALSGTDGADTIRGGYGNDAIAGGAGQDELHGEAGNDRLDGGSGRDALFGGAGADLLIGGRGADTMAGGTGNDSYLLDDARDAVVEAPGEGFDSISATVSLALPANVEQVLLQGTGALDATGNALNNVLAGNAQGNRLDGGPGADTMFGGAGDDVYGVDNPGDVVVERSGEGTDAVEATVSFTLPAHVERLVLAGTSAINGTGNGAANLILGNSATNTLRGEGGIDALHGAGGDDVLADSSGRGLLHGGDGNDVLTGGANPDLLAGASGADTIATGGGADVIVFRRGDGADVLRASVRGNDDDDGDDEEDGGDDDGATGSTVSIGGARFDELRLARAGEDLLLKLADSGDSLRFVGWYGEDGRDARVSTLQLVVDSAADYDAAAADRLASHRVVQLSFTRLVKAFDAAYAANASIGDWAIPRPVLDAAFRAGSDASAIGGDLAYGYAHDGDFAGVDLASTLGVLGGSGFGTAPQPIAPRTGAFAEPAGVAPSVTLFGDVARAAAVSGGSAPDAGTGFEAQNTGALQGPVVYGRKRAPRDAAALVMDFWRREEEADRDAAPATLLTAEAFLSAPVSPWQDALSPAHPEFDAAAPTMADDPGEAQLGRAMRQRWQAVETALSHLAPAGAPVPGAEGEAFQPRMHDLLVLGDATAAGVARRRLTGSPSAMQALRD